MRSVARRDKQGGVMLLEALIGLLLFSMGILAVVGMQAAAIKNVAESKYRADASFLANQVIGQMWVNRANLATFSYAGGTPPTVIEDWVATLNNTLPGGAANPPSIVIGPNNLVTVTVQWQSPEEANAVPPAPPHVYTAVAQING